MTIVSILRVSDAFCSVWEELAADAGVSVRYVDNVEALAAAATIGLVAAGGEEDAIADIMSRVSGTGTPVAAVGALTSHRLAVAAIRAGASDYFAFPGDASLLVGWLQEQVQREESRANRDRVASIQRAKYSFDGILGSSPALRHALGQAERIIPRRNVTVLLRGETGTGKELLARAIHYQGPRREAPFVDINCAAIPEQLLESELFGHEKGAYTGATSAKPGLFEVASGGTLFLDEIGHLALPLQGKLLRVLEERTLRRVGGVRTTSIDVRVITATHVDLSAEVQAGRYRADLYHRLNVVPIELPALRQRADDILPLARTFLDALARQYDLPPPSLTPAAETRLERHDWPGNIRELRNAVERALLLADAALLDGPDFDFLGASTAAHAADGSVPLTGTLQEMVRSAAVETITRCRGNKSAAARRLGISRPRLMRLITRDASCAFDLGDSDA